VHSFLWIAGVLLVLMGALLSATILDSAIGAWLAIAIVFGLAIGRLLGVIPGVGFDGDGG
jgi:hypothetical protein